MYRSITNWGVAALLIFFASCDKLEYSPNVKFDRNTPTELNAKNLKKLQSATDDDTVRFILCGDSQRGYTETQELVRRVNRTNGIDFVVVAGDIADFGLVQEMEWMADIFSGLQVPYFAVVGNHDLTAHGEAAFRRIYGDLNYSFIFHGYKFICLNTNSREYKFDGTVPDLNWLNQQVQGEAGVDGTIAVSHISPFSGDFDKSLESGFVAALERAGNCLASLHAHDHNSGQHRPYPNQIPFIVASAILKREFTLIEIINGKLEAREVEY